MSRPGQQVRVVIDVSIDLAMAYDSATVRAIVERGARLVFRNNFRTFHGIKFAEEAALYAPGETQWVSIIPAPEVSPAPASISLNQQIST